MLYQLAALTADETIPVLHSSDVSLLKELGNRFLSDLKLYRNDMLLTKFAIGECHNDTVSFKLGINGGGDWSLMS